MIVYVFLIMSARIEPHRLIRRGKRGIEKNILGCFCNDDYMAS